MGRFHLWQLLAKGFVNSSIFLSICLFAYLPICLLGLIRVIEYWIATCCCVHNYLYYDSERPVYLSFSFQFLVSRFLILNELLFLVYSFSLFSLGDAKRAS